MPQLIEHSIVETLHERQQRIQSHLPRFAKSTSLLAGICFLLYSGFHLAFNSLYREQFVDTFLANFGLATLIAGTLGLFSNIVIWLFVFWSIAFIPYIAYHAHQASRESTIRVSTRPLRWVQLYAATFLPMAIFAIAWNSFATNTETSYVLRVSPKDLIVLAVCTGVVVILITIINAKIPVKFAVIRLSFFSILLYTSLFLTYGRGFTMASQAMVFGILIYLTFGAGQLSELARRISLHDIDPNLADDFEGIIGHHDALQNLKDETQLKRKEHEVIASKQRLEIEIKQSESDLSLGQQFADMRAKKLELTKQMNAVQLQVLEKKIGFLSEVFAVLSKEMHLRLSSAIPEKIEDLRKRVGTLTPDEIRTEMNLIIGQINSSLQGIPESLADLRTQLIETSTEIEQTTHLIAGGSSTESSRTEKSTGTEG